MPGTVGERVTELVVELVDDSEPVRGRVRSRAGTAAEFSGWSEFAAVLDRLRVPDGQSAHNRGAADEAWMSVDRIRADTSSTAGPSARTTSKAPGSVAAPRSQPAGGPPPCNPE